MAILEKEVWAGLGGNNAKYFENLGYDIPRSINKYGNLTIPIGTKILVKVKELPKSSNEKLTKICDDCGKHIPRQPYKAIIELREVGNGKDRCRSCGNLYKWKIEKENVPYQRTLEYFSIKNGFKYLLDEFSNSNILTPDKIFKASNDLYLWNCSVCNSEYPASVNNRINNRNCPYCAGRKINHTNCLWTTHPKVAKLLKNKEIGYKVSAGMDKKEEFVCSDCGYVDKKSIQDIVKLGYSCVKCSDGISYPEKFMLNLLSQLKVEFQTQKVFEWSLNKRYDFYIPSLNCIIETHGAQHYKESFIYIGGKSLEDEQKNDQIKKEIAIENGMKNYIIIDCSKSEIGFIKNKIIESAISNYYDLSIVNWEKCHEFSCSSIVRKVCDFWNDGLKSTVEIAKIVKVDRATICRYLKQGVEIGWSDYNPKEQIKKSVAINGKKSAKQIVQLTKNDKYIKTWNSITEVQYELKISISNISNVCKGKRSFAGGFKWVYKTDYDKLIETEEII